MLFRYTNDLIIQLPILPIRQTFHTPYKQGNKIFCPFRMYSTYVLKYRRIHTMKKTKTKSTSPPVNNVIMNGIESKDRESNKMNVNAEFATSVRGSDTGVRSQF